MRRSSCVWFKLSLTEYFSPEVLSQKRAEKRAWSVCFPRTEVINSSRSDWLLLSFYHGDFTSFRCKYHQGTLNHHLRLPTWNIREFLVGSVEFESKSVPLFCPKSGSEQMLLGSRPFCDVWQHWDHTHLKHECVTFRGFGLRCCVCTIVL